LNKAGNLIAFSSNVSGQYQIYTMDSSGNSLTQLTTLGNNRDPAFNVAGTKILYTSQQSGQPQIYIMNTDGSGNCR